MVELSVVRVKKKPKFLTESSTIRLSLTGLLYQKSLKRVWVAQIMDSGLKMVGLQPMATLIKVGIGIQ